MRIVVTGHRSKDLNNIYKFNYQSWQDLGKEIKELILNQIQYLKEYEVLELIAGGSQGIDLCFSMISIRIREELKGKVNIKVINAIPCLEHSSKMFQETLKYYSYVLDNADKNILVTNKTYKPYLMQKRNMFMVDKLTDENDFLLAVWNGIEKKGSGTLNCINYAKNKNKKIIYINPTKYFY